MIQILIVDDNTDLLEELKKLITLSNKDSEIQTVTSSDQAITLIKNKSFDLVITDMSMEEDTSGLDVLRAVKEKDVLTQVIVVTEYERPSLEVKALEEGAFDYLKRGSNNYIDNLLLKVHDALLFRESKK